MKTLIGSTIWGVVFIGLIFSFLMNIFIWIFIHKEAKEEKLRREAGNISLTTEQKIKQDFALKEAAIAPNYDNTINTAAPIVPISNMKVTPNNAIANTDLKAQRCAYNGQDYALGDIAKVDQRWIRCTPTITFTQDRPTMPISNSSAWVLVQ